MFVGYRSVSKTNERYATESTGVWEDRQFLDSIVQKQKERKKSAGKPPPKKSNAPNKT